MFVIDADRIGHVLLSDESVRDSIVSAFGVGVLDSSGQIDRRRLAAEVFGESFETHLKRTQLNEIMHPAILAEINEQIKHRPVDAEAVILDAALLSEVGWGDECDAVIYIDTPLEIRQQRVARTRGWTVEEHRRREASQWCLERKRSLADFQVDNSGTPETAALQMEQFVKAIIKKASATE